MVLYDGDHGFLSVKLRDCQFFFGTQFVPTGLHWYPLWLFTWSFGYSSTASDGSPYEKRVDAKGHVLSDKSIADEVPFEKLPVGWAWARLAGVASIQLGKMLDKQKNEGEPVPYLGNANVQWGEFDLANIKTMRMNEADRAKFVLANGDLIVCEGGVPGRCAIWTSNKTMYYQKALHRVRCDKRLLLNTYCELYIRLIVQSHIWDGCFTGTTIKHLPAQTLSGWVLPVPPLAEQRCIVERVDQLMPLVEECGKLEDDREALDAALPERLRKSVLQMAVQGKLVPQDPSDEPASELLERIRDQRRQLIAEKKMRAPKGGESVIFRGSDGRRYEKRVDAKGRESEPVCIEDEIPFEVPNNWEWARLESVADIINGFTPKRSEAQFWDNGKVPWFTASDIRTQGRIISKTEQTITSLAMGKRRTCPPDTVLICCTASVGEAVLTKIPLVTNQQFNSLVQFEEDECRLVPQYLLLWSLTVKHQLVKTAGTTTIPFVSVAKLGKLLIPVPSTAEQHRIVERVNKLMPLITSQ